MSSILAAPSYLWNWYIHYLWNYDSDSWVATIASAFRLWAILAILPTLILGLLDVTSYIIARTLGDPTASTSHNSSFAAKSLRKSEPKISIIDTSASPTGPSPVSVPITIALPSQDDDELPSGVSVQPPAAAAVSSPTYFMNGVGEEDDGAARLAGVGVFSPVASMPGSPVVSRRNLLENEGEEDGDGVVSASRSSRSSAVPGDALPRGGRAADREEEKERGRGGHGQGHERSTSGGSGVNGTGSMSGESLLDREDSFEDASAHIRRRVPGMAGADD